MNVSGYRRWLRGLAAVFFVLGVGGLVGCGPARYIPAIRSAEKSVEIAADANADTYAPYWFARAQAYLAKAKEEAGAADYGRAIDFAEISKSSAERATSQSRERGPSTEQGERDD